MSLLLALLLLAALVPVLIVRTGLYYRLLRTRYHDAFDNNIELARAAAGTFNGYINDLVHEERTVGLALAYLEPPASAAAGEFLATNAAQYPSVIRLHWADPQGRILNSSDPAYIGKDIRQHDHFAQALASNTWVLDDLTPSMTNGTPIFMVDHCVRDKEGNPLGVVVAVVDPQRLERELLNIGEHPDGRIMIVDRQRRIVCSDPRMGLSWDKRSLENNELILQSLAGQEASGIVNSFLDHERRAAAVVPIGHLGWAAVACRSVSGIVGPLRQDLLVTTGVTGIVVVMSLLLALLIQRQISRGVRSLQEHATALAEGHLDHRAEIIGIAELQAVAEAFNRTAVRRQQAEQQLRELNDTLEQRVAERSAVAEQRAEQLRAMVAELSQAEQRERHRLAQVLHDDLQQTLAAGKFHAGSLQKQLTDNTLRQRLATIIDLIDQSIGTSRSLAIELSPPVLYEAGLPAAIDWLAHWMKSKHGLHVEVRTDEATPPQSEEIKVLLFQAARELLFNITKHANVSLARVELRGHESGQVMLVIQDNGVGFDPGNRQGPSSGGFGLFSIRERLELLGGRMEIESAPGAGTRITLLAPSGIPPPDADTRQQPHP